MQPWPPLPRLTYAAKVAALTGPRWGLALGRKGGGGDSEPSAVSLTKARSKALSEPASCTIQSFRHKASIQETKVRDPGLPDLIALLGPGTSSEGWGVWALQVTGCESEDRG